MYVKMFIYSSIYNKNENNEKICIQNCDEKIYIKNDVKYCVENCPENIYEYPKSDGKTYCVENCSDNTYEYHDITENKKYCLDDFLNKFKYIKDDKKYYIIFVLVKNIIIMIIIKKNI